MQSASAGQKQPALRVRIRGRYVLRPSGKHRHQFSPSPPLGAGSKTGLVKRRPFAFCCKVLRDCLLLVVWSLRGWVGSCGVVLRTTPHPGLVRSWLRHHRLCSGGRVSR